MSDEPRTSEGGEQRVVLAKDADGELDDVVIRDVKMFRMERMDDDHIWIACYLEGDEDVVFDVHTDLRLTIRITARDRP